MTAEDGSTLDLRRHIIEAAERLVRQRGVVGITVREIAREAGIADGTLYNHFLDKEEVLAEAILRRLPELEAVFYALPAQAGTGTVEGNLRGMFRSLFEYEHELVPLLGSLFSEPRLMTRLAERFHAADQHRYVRGALADYLRAEKDLGRIDQSADPDAASRLLLGAVHDIVFMGNLMGGKAPSTPDPTLVDRLVGTLTRGLAPRG